jgi:large subunit ribosomal protein L9
VTKIILRADVGDLGKRGDILDVAEGYARNYLVPKGLAMKASPGAETQAGRMRKARDLRDAQDRAAAETVASQLVPKVVTLTARAGSEGRLFGSITTSDIVAAVAQQTGVELDRRRVRLDEPIKSTGTHSVPVKLHADVEFPVTIEVTAG